MQAGLSIAQLDYCKAVLGLDRVVVPQMDFLDSTKEEKKVEVRGVLHGSKVVALVPLLAGEFPLCGEPASLLDKMLVAMKIATKEVLLVTWQTDESHAVPDEVAQIAASAGSRPVVVFGGTGAAQRLIESDSLGEWGVWGESRVLVTYSPHELLRSPDKKRLAWVHLQAVMKHL